LKLPKFTPETWSLARKKNSDIAMFDRWNKTDLINSRYLWLPIEFDGDRIKIEWRDK